MKSATSWGVKFISLTIYTLSNRITDLLIVGKATNFGLPVTIVLNIRNRVWLLLLLIYWSVIAMPLKGLSVSIFKIIPAMELLLLLLSTTNSIGDEFAPFVYRTRKAFSRTVAQKLGV